MFKWAKRKNRFPLQSADTVGDALIRRDEIIAQQERTRAANICVSEARACNRVVVAETLDAQRFLKSGRQSRASACIIQSALHRERRDALMSAARKIMGSRK